MKQILTACAIVAAASVLFSSCSSNSGLAIEKRKHRGGYHITWYGKSDNKHTAKPAETAAEITVTQAEKLDTPKEIVVAAAPVVLEERQSVYPAPVTTEAEFVSVQPVAKNSTSQSLTSGDFTRAELKELRKEMRKNVKQEFRKAASGSDLPDWLIAVFCIILPPLAVALRLGIGTDFWINILLTLLFWIPGVIHAFVVIF